LQARIIKMRLEHLQKQSIALLKSTALCALLVLLPTLGFAQTFTNSTLGNITDNTCFDRTFTVPALTVSDLNVSINITHTWRGDLTLRLTSPAGTQVTFLNRNGGSADNVNALFDDEATVTIASDTVSHTAQVQRIPAAALTAFDGPSISGTWTLQVCDLANADTGTFNTASLIFNAPRFRLQKALPSGRFVAADQFALNIAGTGGPATLTTTGSGITATGIATLSTASSGAIYTLSETGAAGAVLSNYASTYTCTNALALGQTPSGSGASFTITAVSGDDILCTFSNQRNAIADLSIIKSDGVTTRVSGSSTVYTITVANNGPDSVTGAVIKDAAAAGLSCNDPVPCSGAACPSATVTLASLQGVSGVILSALANTATVTLTLTCTVTATGF
jgi:uncharacterized repeat protein (TIGR01451 family)